MGILSLSPPVSSAPFLGFYFFCPRCSLGLLLIMLRATSLSDSALPRRLGFAFFFIKRRSADEGGPVSPSAEEAADEGLTDSSR